MPITAMHTHSRAGLKSPLRPTDTRTYSSIPKGRPPTSPTPSRNTGRIQEKAAASPDSSLFRRPYSSRDRTVSTRATAVKISRVRQPWGVRPLAQSAFCM